MNLFVVFLCIITFFVVHRFDKNLYNPVKLFMVVWGTLFFVYNLDWYPLPYITERTYTLVIIGLIFFVIGSALASIFFKKKMHNVKVERPLVFRLALIFFFISMIIPFFNGLRLLLSGVNLHDIRYEYHDDIIGTGIGAITFVYFSEPFLVFYLFYAVANIYRSHKPVLPVLYALLGIIMMTVARGGRFYLLYFMFALIIAKLIYRGSRLSKKVNKFIVSLFAIGLFAIVGVSLIRGSDVGSTFYVYLSGSIPFLNHLLEDYGSIPPTLGLYSLNGFIRPIFVLLRAIGVMDLPIYMQLVEEVSLQTDEAYSIMPGEVYNSFTTLFYSLYIDGGLVGVSIGNLLLGLFSMMSYRRLEKNNIASVVLFLLFAVMLLLSFFRLLVVSYSYALAFFYVIVCFKKTRIRD